MTDGAEEVAASSSDAAMFSFPQFRSVTNEITERLKVCSSASCFMEDLADIENSLGKSLAKVGNRPIELAKSEFMPGISYTWETAIKIVSEFTGKHHSNVSYVISQNISRVLSDLHRLNGRRIIDLRNKIKSQHLEYSRCKESHLRKQAKYIKTVKEAEIAIRQRYSALEIENKTGGDRERAAKDSLPIDENLMKSFSKMIAKIAPVDSQKRWNEKFMDILKELDLSESNLKTSCQQLNAVRDIFLADVESAIEECKTLEMSRISSVKENLIELSSMQGLIYNEEKEAYAALHHKVENIDVNVEVAALLWSVDRLVISDVTVDPALMNDYEKNVHVVSADFYSSDRTKNSGVIFHKVQQTLEVLDYFKNLVNCVGVSLKGTAEAKRTYSKAMYSCIEKHGLSISQSPSSPTVRATQGTKLQRATKSGVKADSLKRFQSQLQSATGLDGGSVVGIFTDHNQESFADLLLRVQSQSSSSVWMALITAFLGIAMSHSKLAEKCYEYFLPTLSGLQRRIYAMKNELMTKQISNMKLIDNSQAAVLKLSQKVEKVRYLMKVQQEKVEKSKEEVAIGTPVSASATAGRVTVSPDSGSQFRKAEMEDELESTPVPRPRSNSSAAEEETTEAKKEGDKRGKASKILQQGLDRVGSRLQKARMTVVAGLASENQEERLERREGRMQALELEETELLAAFYAANTSMDTIEEAVRKEIDDCLKAAKEVICHDVNSFVDILKQLSESQMECASSVEAPVGTSKSLSDAMNTDEEFSHFISSVQIHFVNSEAEAAGREEDKNPAVTNFSPLYSKIIEDEKICIGLLPDYSPTTEGDTGRNNLPQSRSEGVVGGEVSDDCGQRGRKSSKENALSNDSETCTLDSVKSVSSGDVSLHSLLTSAQESLRGKISVNNDSSLYDSPCITSSQSQQQLEENGAAAPETNRVRTISGVTIPDGAAEQLVRHKSTTALPSESNQNSLESGSRSMPNMLMGQGEGVGNASAGNKGVEEDSTKEITVNTITKELMISETLRQNLCGGELITDLSLEMTSASSTTPASACMSPSALPPRPPLPPRPKKVDVKEKDKDKAGSQPASISNTPNADHTGNTLPDLTGSTDNWRLASCVHEDKIMGRLEALKGDIGIAEDCIDRAEVETVRKNLVDEDGFHATDSDEKEEHDRSRSNILTSKAFQESPQVMRIKESTSSATGNDVPHTSVNNATVGMNKKIPQNIGNKPEDSAELIKFGLSPSVRLLESFSCALYPKKGLLTHGRIFVTQHYLAFSGWPEMRLLLALKDINRVEKCNTLYYIPNAILVNSETYGEFFFGSFIDRDVCFALLNNMSQIAKRLIEIKRDNNTLPPETEQLIFGLRVPKGGGVESYLEGIQAKAAAGWNALPTSVNSIQELSGFIGIKTEEGPGVDKTRYLADGTAEEGWTEVPSREEVVSSSNSSTDVTAAASTTPTSVSPSISDYDNYRKDAVDLGDLFTRHNIQSLCTHVLPFRLIDVLKTCWVPGAGYGDFLTEEGDIEIGYGDWSVLSTPTVPEDITGLAFSYSRTFNYSHPRTTMLMFGPKNAPAKQTHYMYLPIKSAAPLKGGEEIGTAAFISKQQVPQGVVMIVTQFDGIPMADCFKIVQYFTFEESSAATAATTVRIGVNVHFVKYTMLKAQVRDGVKEELSVLSQKWCTYAKHQAPKVSNEVIAIPSEPSSVTAARTLILPETGEGDNKNVGDTVLLKEKKPSRKLPKTFISQETEKSTLGYIKSVLKIVSAFLDGLFESRIGGILILLFFLIIVLQWRHNFILAQRLKTVERNLELLGQSVTSQSNNYQQLLDEVRHLSTL